MSVFDKELIINGEAVRSPEQQVYKNMKDIQVLKGKIKDVFKTTATLTSSSVSVALADTNVTDEEEGWLMSEDGLLFAITGNDGTNLLISFYTDLKGPQGDTGSTGLTGPAGYSIRYSSEDFVPGTTSYTKSNVHPTYQIKSGDFIVFANGYIDLITTVGDSTINVLEDGEVLLDIPGGINVVANPTLDGTEASLTGLEVGTTKYKIDTGKQLYLHNIKIVDGSGLICYCQIINDSNTAFTGLSLFNFLTNNGFNGTASKAYQATGVISGNVIHSLSASGSDIWFGYGTAGTNKSYTVVGNNLSDYVITL